MFEELAKTKVVVVYVVFVPAATVGTVGVPVKVGEAKFASLMPILN
jgi:hypothetical protein